MNRYKVKAVPSNLANGYYATVIDTRFDKVIFCSYISSYRGPGRKKPPTPEAQATGFINRRGDDA